MGRLTGGVAIIKVGGASEVEVSELKDRIEDALCATRAAQEEGVVSGGGTALLYASTALNDLKGANFDQDQGIKIVKEACKIPCKTICWNSGFEGAIVTEKLLEAKKPNHGFDASVGEYCDMIQKGIIDPTKVTRTALENAASVAGTVLLTECIVVDEPKEENSQPQMDPSMMMGM